MIKFKTYFRNCLNNSGIIFIQNILYSVFSKMLYYYSSAMVFIDDNVNKVCEKHDWIKKGIDTFYFYKTKTFNFIYNLKTYPENNWHNIIKITGSNDNYKYIESYNGIKDSTNEEKFMLDMKNNYNDLYECRNKNNICLMSKFNEILCVQHTAIYIKNNDIFEKSEMNIISVTYKHPKMDESIELTVPKNIFYCHNQLFNAAFVYHCLQYQSMPYIFDENYNIEILDSNVDSKIIKYNEYLHIYKDKMTVQSLE